MTRENTPEPCLVGYFVILAIFAGIALTAIV